MSRKTVDGESWTELVGANFEDDYSIVVGSGGGGIYFVVGDKPAQPVAGLPLSGGAIYSAVADRGERIYARSQTDAPVEVRVVPNVRIDGSNERAVSVQTSVQTNVFTRGGEFETTTSVDVDPDEVVRDVTITASGPNSTLDVVTTEGDEISAPLKGGTGSFDKWKIQSFTARDPDGNTVAGVWAGE